MENHIKDEQIQRQIEEIESQRRKIESLERELQKCLDPDSGEINPTFKQGKHGEVALLEQINDLQKKLDNYLEPSSETVRIRTNESSSTRLNYLVNHIVAGMFKPYEEYNSHTKKYDRQLKIWIWDRLPGIFTRRPQFDDLWLKKSFRLAMHNLQSVFQYMRQAEENNYTKRDLELAAEMLCYGVSQEEHEGTILLRDAIEKLYQIEETDRYDLTSEEIDDMFFSIQIMIQCQRLSLALDANERNPKNEPS